MRKASRTFRNEVIEPLTEQERHELIKISHRHNIPFVDLSEISLTGLPIQLIDRAFALEHLVFPLVRSSKTLKLALAVQGNITAVDELRQTTGLQIEVVLVNTRQMKKIIDFCYRETILIV